MRNRHLPCRHANSKPINHPNLNRRNEVSLQLHLPVTTNIKLPSPLVRVFGEGREGFHECHLLRTAPHLTACCHPCCRRRHRTAARLPPCRCLGSPPGCSSMDRLGQSSASWQVFSVICVPAVPAFAPARPAGSRTGPACPAPPAPRGITHRDSPRARTADWLTQGIHRRGMWSAAPAW